MENLFAFTSTIFFGPFIWMLFLGLMMNTTARRRLEYASLPFAAAIDEIIDNFKWRNLLIYIAFGVAFALLQYFSDSIITSQQVILLWVVVIVIEVIGYEAMAIPIAVLLSVIIGLIFPSFGTNILMIKTGSIYQIAFGAILIFGSRRTFPMMVKLDDDTIIGQHVYARIIPIPLLCLYPGVGTALGLAALVLYFVVDKKLKKQTIDEYATKYGSFMLANGAIGFLLSYLIPSLSLLIAIISIGCAIGFTVYDKIILNKRDYLYAVKETGLSILYVYPNSLAENMGMKNGDHIDKVNGELIMNYEALQVMLDNSITYLWFDIERAGEILNLEHKDYQEGIRELGISVVPRHPVKYMLNDKQRWIL